MPNVSLYCALDARDRPTVERLADLLAPAVGGLKLGLEYFCAHGPEGIGAVGAARPVRSSSTSSCTTSRTRSRAPCAAWSRWSRTISPFTPPAGSP